MYHSRDEERDTVPALYFFQGKDRYRVAIDHSVIKLAFPGKDKKEGIFISIQAVQQSEQTDLRSADAGLINNDQNLLFQCYWLCCFEKRRG